MSKEVLITLSKTTCSLGEKGLTPCTDIVIYGTTSGRDTIIMSAINGRGVYSQCYIEVPIIDIPALIDALQKFIKD
jgi:hypothetical protein